MNATAARWQGFGTTIFTEMSALAERTGAINLGQGFPDEDGPAEVLEAAERALRDGHNQYAPLPGVPALREAIAAHQARFYGMQVDPETEVQVTFGATEAIAAALLGLCEPGDDRVALGRARADGHEVVVVEAHAVGPHAGEVLDRVDGIEWRPHLVTERVAARVADGPQPESEAMFGRHIP